MRQLSLFKGKRQRGERLQPPPEFKTHVALADLLRRWCNPTWRWTHLPFGELRNPKTGARLKRMGANPGYPDFLFTGPKLRVVWLELKREGLVDDLSDAQLEVREHLEASGFPYLVTDNVKTAVAYLRQHGVVRATVQ